jgi:glycosyltransferase involved in cell wall biosynthesis
VPSQAAGERGCQSGARRAQAAAIPVLFYSGWRLGYHNLEAERKARALAAAGYEVTYIGGIGLRNPSVARLFVHSGRIKRILAARIAASRREKPPPAHADGAQPASGELGLRPAQLRLGSLIVTPPRQVALVRALNARWVARQLTRQVSPWESALAWVRWPTPELVDALALLKPAATVYECVDAYEHTPGVVGRWARIFTRYERSLVERSDLVVVPGEQLARRFRALGAEVRIVPHGVDLAPFAWRAMPQSELVVGFVGTLDFRLDIPVLRAIAEHHPRWRLRLIGPIQLGFDPRSLADLPNVSIEPTVAAAEVPRLIASFDLGVMPYADHPHVAHMTPLKCLEFLAAGIPTVARPSLALEPYRGLLYYADSPETFVRQLDRAVAEHSRERSQARRAAAEGNDWPSRLAEITAIVDELTAGR